MTSDSRSAFFRGWFRFGDSLKPAARWTLLAVAWLGFLAAWEYAPRSEKWTRLLPAASQVGSKLHELVTQKDFIDDVASSVRRICVSFAIATAIALPLGIFMGAFPAVEGLLNPLVSPFRYLPAPSFIPLLLAMLGTGDEQKIALLVIGVIWFLITLIMDDTKRVPLELVEVSQTLGASRGQTLKSIILPSALPYFLDTLRQMLAVSWTYLVIAEIVAATDGIGAVMMRARRVLAMDTILACILTIGALGFAFDVLFRWLRWLFFPYLRNTRN